MAASAPTSTTSFRGRPSTGGDRARRDVGRDAALRRTVEHYQQLLRMRDWTVRAEWVPAAKLRGNLARAVPVPERKHVLLSVNEEHPLDDSFRESVAHELIHARVSPLVALIRESPASIMIEESEVAEPLALAIREAERTHDRPLFRAFARLRKSLPERLRVHLTTTAHASRARQGDNMKITRETAEKALASLGENPEGPAADVLRAILADAIAGEGGEAAEPIESDGDEMAEPMADEGAMRADEPGEDDEGERYEEELPEPLAKPGKERKQLGTGKGARDRVYSVAADITGHTDPERVIGGLTALRSDKARLRKQLGDVTAQRDALVRKDRARMRMDILGKLVGAGIHEPGEVYAHDDAGKVIGPSELWGPGKKGRTLENLEGYAAERLRSAPPAQRSPFQPKPADGANEAGVTDNDRALAQRTGLLPGDIARSRKALFGGASAGRI